MNYEQSYWDVLDDGDSLEAEYFAMTDEELAEYYEATKDIHRKYYEEMSDDEF